MTDNRRNEMNSISLGHVSDVLTPHAALYRHRAPVYQTVMLNDLLSVWLGHHDRVLDVGGGTGVMAEAMQALMPAGKVEAVDVVDRYFKNLTVATHVYDGQTLPFADNSFDAATINNVMHHVPVAIRPAVMREIRRVVKGPVYIKDHLKASALDHVRLAVLDLMGNLPFSGMIDARYLTMPQWQRLAAEAGYRIAARTGGTYRRGLMAGLFPNRLEIAFRLDPILD